MKNSALLAIICIGLGFAAGWIAKPDPKPEPEVASVDKPDTKPTRTINKSPNENPEDSKEGKTRMRSFIVGGNSQEEELDPETKGAMDNFSEMMKKNQMAKLDARIAILVDKLNLTPGQEAQLRAAMEKHVDAMSGIFDPGQASGPANPKDMASLLAGDGLEDTLASILTPEQEEAYDALKKRERENKVEASALKNLAKLSFLDLSQEQKDAAYDILYSEAEKSADNGSPGNVMMSVMTSGMGIELDADDLGLSGIMDAQFEGDADSTNPGDIMARMKEAQAKKIDEKVNALSSVLDEQQQEQYRKHLESKNSGIFGGFMHDSIQLEVAEPKKE